MDRAAEAHDAQGRHAWAMDDDDGGITVEPRVKAAPKAENAREHCAGCYCAKEPPKLEIVIDICGTHHKNGRNLIICIDGTANQFGDQNTNVIELYNLLLKGPKD
ncbi:hypothetical protein FA15DRAFT_701498 [Coprinopsis marcescibilis]|uniref:Uncharacterized protein n=1 Tax=Coprinopsis marcescibilis TaxID=230819 RepID=A0A5C3L5G6_COPMA|nr:hypothetical protein FA15DRAFT_701498 [Coprinopsis marcescibilis]